MLRTFLISFIFINFSIQAQIDPNLANQLQDVLNSSVAIQGNNGVSAFLIMPNGQTWNGTAGIGKQNAQITDATLFHGASITKFNIATLMLLLSEENLIDLDKSWSNYISLNAAFDPVITIRQLLNHTSGIADYLETANSGNDIISDFNFFYTPQHILENIVSSVPDFPAGTNFQYSNSNYALATLIIEEVTGNPIHMELRKRIWDPLEMNHTYFGAYETYTEPSAGVWWNFGNGLTDYSSVSTTSMLSYAYGAGNIVSCPTDLGILLDAILKGELIDSESLDEMLTFVPDSFNSWTAGYGLGIHHANVHPNDVVIGHDGYYTNMTDMFHSMNHEFTLVTMTNTLSSWFGIFNPMYDILSNYFMSTSINDLDIGNEIKIYPNPSKNIINIESPNIIDEVIVTDLLGKIYYKSKPQVKDVNLSIDMDGLYFVSVTSNQNISSQKLIIKK